MARRRNRRRSRARENPIELIPFLLLLGGAAAAIGTGVYVATRPKGIAAGSNAGSNSGSGVQLQTGKVYTFGSANPGGLPATAQAFADGLSTNGWANIAVFYYGPTGQGAIPSNISVGPGGYVADGTWMDPPTSMDPTVIVVEGAPTTDQIMTPNHVAVAINWGGNGHGGSATVLTGGSAHSGGTTNPVQNAINQANSAVNQAQNTAQSVSDQANGAVNSVNSLTSQFSG